MTHPIINIGTVPQDGTGTPAPLAGQLLNRAFAGSGILAGFRSAIAPPPIVPAMWSTAARVVGDYTFLNSGDRFSPQWIREISPGMYICMYNGNQAANMIAFNTSLAYSYNLTDWIDHGPVMQSTSGDTAQSWEGIRRRGKHIIWDEGRGEWVLFYDSNGAAANSPDGLTIRATGLAFSKNLNNWTKLPANPIFWASAADLPSWQPADSNIGTAQWVAFYEGTYYACVASGNRTAQNYRYGILTATNPGGPWTGGTHNPIYNPHVGGPHWHAGFAFPMDPTYVISERKWYMPIHNQTGQVGFLTADNLLGPWTDLGSPVIQVPGGADALHPQIIPLSGGTYACVAMQPGAGQPHADHMATIVLMTSHLPPTQFRGIKDFISKAVVAHNSDTEAHNGIYLKVSDKATSADMIAGTNNTRWTTPLRVHEAITERTGGETPPEEFELSSLPGFTFWFDAKDEATRRSLTTSDTANLDAWTNNGSLSYEMQQATGGSQPSLNYSGGQWRVTASGSQSMVGNGGVIAAMQGIDAATLFCLWATNSVSGEQCAIGWQNNSGTTDNNPRFLLTRNRTANGSIAGACRRLDGDTTARAVSAGGFAGAGVLSVDTLRVDYAAGLMRVYNDNTQRAEVSFTAGPLTSTTSSACRMFRTPGGSAFQTAGSICALVLCRAALTTEQMTQAVNALKVRYGIV
jgi:hypothetical protein